MVKRKLPACLVASAFVTLPGLAAAGQSTMVQMNCSGARRVRVPCTDSRAAMDQGLRPRSIRVGTDIITPPTGTTANYQCTTSSQSGYGSGYIKAYTGVDGSGREPLSCRLTASVFSLRDASRTVRRRAQCARKALQPYTLMRMPKANHHISRRGRMCCRVKTHSYRDHRFGPFAGLGSSKKRRETRPRLRSDKSQLHHALKRIASPACSLEYCVSAAKNSLLSRVSRHLPSTYL